MRFIDFFAGVGGFRRGMELAGHECVGHCEIDKYAEASYRSMHTITEAQRSVLATMPAQQRRNEILKGEYLNGEWYADDIRSVRHSDPPEAECYCFGFPCQSFSIAGHRRGFEDTRGTLFFEVMRIAKERQPKILFAENVTGLLNHEGGSHSVQSSMQWQTWGTLWNGKCLTADISEYRRIEKECSLSDILETEVEDKYFLSQQTIRRLMSYKDSEIVL